MRFAMVLLFLYHRFYRVHHSVFSAAFTCSCSPADSGIGSVDLAFSDLGSWCLDIGDVVVFENQLLWFCRLAKRIIVSLSREFSLKKTEKTMKHKNKRKEKRKRKLDERWREATSFFWDIPFFSSGSGARFLLPSCLVQERPDSYFHFPY